MDYIEIKISGLSDFDPDIVVAFLSELGFESFSDTDDGILAYCRTDLYNEPEVTSYLRQLNETTGAAHQLRTIPPENWNARWEQEYQPVVINDLCRIRAPFHPASPDFLFDIVIEPKMSFGTAHHETTSMMLELLLKEELEGATVLDMGCGTGVLAILAAMKNAGKVVAVDTDDWAFQNTIENITRNGVNQVSAILGDIGSVPHDSFDVILANINRNVLLSDIPAYAGLLSGNGVLFLSGFYEDDLPLINEKCTESGLELDGYTVKNNWVGAKYCKE
jgi:ribosomal protein L11 methyltransferase